MEGKSHLQRLLSVATVLFVVLLLGCRHSITVIDGQNVWNASTWSQRVLAESGSASIVPNLLGISCIETKDYSHYFAHLEVDRLTCKITKHVSTNVAGDKTPRMWITPDEYIACKTPLEQSWYYNPNEREIYRVKAGNATKTDVTPSNYNEILAASDHSVPYLVFDEEAGWTLITADIPNGRVAVWQGADELSRTGSFNKVVALGRGFLKGKLNYAVLRQSGQILLIAPGVKPGQEAPELGKMGTALAYAIKTQKPGSYRIANERNQDYTQNLFVFTRFLAAYLLDNKLLVIDDTGKCSTRPPTACVRQASANGPTEPLPLVQLLADASQQVDKDWKDPKADPKRRSLIKGKPTDSIQAAKDAKTKMKDAEMAKIFAFQAFRRKKQCANTMANQFSEVARLVPVSNYQVGLLDLDYQRLVLLGTDPTVVAKSEPPPAKETKALK
jgi:hypothetical protein